MHTKRLTLYVNILLMFVSSSTLAGRAGHAIHRQLRRLDFDLGVDAVFSDHPDMAIAVRSELLKNNKSFVPASSKVHHESAP